MDYKNNSSYKNSNINTNKLENKNVSFWVKTISFLVILENRKLATHKPPGEEVNSIVSKIGPTVIP